MRMMVTGRMMVTERMMVTGKMRMMVTGKMMVTGRMRMMATGRMRVMVDRRWREVTGRFDLFHLPLRKMRKEEMGKRKRREKEKEKKKEEVFFRKGDLVVESVKSSLNPILLKDRLVISCHYSQIISFDQFSFDHQDNWLVVKPSRCFLLPFIFIIINYYYDLLFIDIIMVIIIMIIIDKC